MMYHDLYDRDVSSPAECKALCQNNTNCKAFVVNECTQPVGWEEGRHREARLGETREMGAETRGPASSSSRPSGSWLAHPTPHPPIPTATLLAERGHRGHDRQRLVPLLWDRAAAARAARQHPRPGARVHQLHPRAPERQRLARPRRRPDRQHVLEQVPGAPLAGRLCRGRAGPGADGGRRHAQVSHRGGAAHAQGAPLELVHVARHGPGAGRAVAAEAPPHGPGDLSGRHADAGAAADVRLGVVVHQLYRRRQPARREQRAGAEELGRVGGAGRRPGAARVLS